MTRGRGLRVETLPERYAPPTFTQYYVDGFSSARIRFGRAGVSLAVFYAERIKPPLVTTRRNSY